MIIYNIYENKIELHYLITLCSEQQDRAALSDGRKG